MREFAPTCRGGNGSSFMIDHVAIPLRWCDAEGCASPIRATGRKPHVILIRERRDNMQVLAQTQAPRWGRGQRRQPVLGPDGLELSGKPYVGIGANSCRVFE
eukprot:6981561-Pyramimonas_sp.AAC.1